MIPQSHLAMMFEKYILQKNIYQIQEQIFLINLENNMKCLYMQYDENFIMNGVITVYVYVTIFLSGKNFKSVKKQITKINRDN